MRQLSFYNLISAILLLVAIAFTACSSPQSAKSEKPLAVVSILPQKSLVQAIAGDRFKIMVLVPEEGNHETYEPEARQLVELSSARVYFGTGLLGFERSWLPGISENNPDMQVVSLSAGVPLIHGREVPHGDHVHEGGIDPHIWLSVSSVRTQAAQVVQVLSHIDPDNASEYENAYNQYVLHLDSLNKVLEEILQPIAHRSFMIFHPSLGYFARDYNLDQIPIEYEGKEPGPAYLKSLVEIAREKDIHTLFVSSQFNSQSAEVIANQINGTVKSFNPTALNWEESLLKVARDIAAASKTATP